jgi:chromosome segregation ATPase
VLDLDPLSSDRTRLRCAITQIAALRAEVDRLTRVYTLSEKTAFTYLDERDQLKSRVAELEAKLTAANRVVAPYTDVCMERDRLAAELADAKREVVEAIRQKDICRIDAIKLRDMLEASKNGHWYGRMITAETQAVDLKKERDEARGQRDRLAVELAAVKRDRDEHLTGHYLEYERSKHAIAERDELKSRVAELEAKLALTQADRAEQQRVAMELEAELLATKGPKS